MPDANGNYLPGERRPGLINSTTPGGQSITSYNPTQAAATSAGSQGYNAEGVTVNKSTDTVQGQLEGIIAKDSPLMMQADRKAREAAAAKGLLNTSLAVGTAQEAVIGQALPIAQQDASTYFTANTKTVDAKNAERNFTAAAANQASLANAQLGTDVSKFNANASNEADAAASLAANNAALAKLDADTRMSLGNLDAQTRLTTANLDAKTRMDLGQLDARTRMDTAQLDANTRMQLGQLDAQTRLTTTQMQADVQMAQARLDAETRTQIAQMDSNTRMAMTQIEADNRSMLQTSQNAANLYNSAANAITNISIQTNLSPEAKNAAIQTQLNMLREGMRATGDVAGMDLSQYYMAAPAPVPQNVPVTQANFDSQRYLADNPDVAAGWKESAWEHYVKNGIREGRKAYAVGA